MNNHSDLTITEDFYDNNEANELTTTKSLEDWLAHNIPSSPDMMQPHSDGFYYGFCQCCQQSNCQQLESMLNIIRKLEEDVQLAAALGQNLLQKHEQYIVDTNKLKAGLEFQVEGLRDKVRELQDSLVESDTAKEFYLDERNKCMRQLQRIEKALYDTTSELNESSARCVQLGKELKAKMKQVEKLSVFKLLAKQADIREETLITKVEDLKQELAYSRKAELTLESKHKKLEANFEKLSIAYEELLSSQTAPMSAKSITHNDKPTIEATQTSDAHSLQEMNERLRQQVAKLTAATTALLNNHVTRNNASDMQNETIMMYMLLGMMNDKIQKSHSFVVDDNDHLIEIIEELATTNHRLKNELLEYNDLLSEKSNECSPPCGVQAGEDDKVDNDVHGIQQCQECISSGPVPNFSSSTPSQSDVQSTRHQKFWNRLLYSNNGNMTTVDESNDHHSESMGHYQKQPQALLSFLPSTQPAAPLPAAKAAQYHYHYHYHSTNDTNSSITKDSNDNIIDYNKAMAATETANLCEQLSTKVKNIEQKIKRTEIKALSRQQRQQQQKVVDMMDLTLLSNSLLKNIVLNDIRPLEKHIPSDATFLPLLLLFKDLLTEMCQLRINLNDLQVDYVRKVRESDAQFKDRVWKKLGTNSSSEYVHYCEEIEELDLSKAFSHWISSLISTSTLNDTLSRHTSSDFIAARSSDYCRLHTKLITASDISKRHALYSSSGSSSKSHHDLTDKGQQHHYGRKMSHKRSMPLLVNNNVNSLNSNDGRRYPVPELQVDHGKSRIVVKRFKPSASTSSPICTTTQHVHGTTTTTTSMIMKRRVLHNHLQYMIV